MKTAISIPDSIFEAAERLAKRLGLSRSELYSRAVANYIEENRACGVRERLDAVYSTDPESSALHPDVVRIQSDSIPQDEW